MILFPNLQKLADAECHGRARGFEHSMVGDVQIAKVSAREDDVDLADGVAALLDVIDSHLRVGKRPQPQLGEPEVSLATVLESPERTALEHGVTRKQVGGVGKPPFVEACVVLPDQKMRGHDQRVEFNGAGRRQSRNSTAA